MTNIDNVEHLTINVGDQHMNGGVAGNIAISTQPPLDIGAGCTVYLFNCGKLKGMDVLFEFNEAGSKPTIERVRAHADLSPLDRVCVDAILTRYEGNPPNEVFCKLEKLDSSAVRSLSALGSVDSTVIEDVVENVVEDVDEDQSEVTNKTLRYEIPNNIYIEGRGSND